MLKLLLCFNLWLLVAQVDCKVYKRGPLLEDNSIDDENKNNNNNRTQWQSPWFPHPPHDQNDVKTDVKIGEKAGVRLSSPSWQGLWFPHPPDNGNNGSKGDVKKESVASFKEADDLSNSSSWQGLWFPHPPDYEKSDVKGIVKNENVANFEKKDGFSKSSAPWQGMWFPHRPKVGGSAITKTLSRAHKYDDFLEHRDCDNGKTNIAFDFDPEDKRHSYMYLCLGNRTEYQPNFNTTALLMEHLVPASYQPPVRCLSERIIYNESPPTFGPYRPLAPQFGSYTYLPPQRWLHSLYGGAIVLLYHPCAFSGQIKQLQNILQGCLYRHIITPSQVLSPQRPLALLAWGKCLQMSVVDERLAVKFIKDNAILGFRGKQEKLNVSSHLYKAGLINEAHLVTNEEDSEICGYKEM